ATADRQPSALTRPVHSPLDSTPSPYTTLFRSWPICRRAAKTNRACGRPDFRRNRVLMSASDEGLCCRFPADNSENSQPPAGATRSEEHTSELQSPDQLVCRPLLEKKHTRRQRE